MNKIRKSRKNLKNSVVMIRKSNKWLVEPFQLKDVKAVSWSDIEDKQLSIECVNPLICFQ